MQQQTVGEKPDNKRRSFLSLLGPGLITGAADDDPSGIATYSLAGGFFGYMISWTMVLSLPLMAAIQETSARVGRITGRGIANNVRRHYSPWLLYPIVAVLAVTNIINLGADVGAMGESLRLIVGGPAMVYAVGFAVASAVAQVLLSYKCYESILKWMTLVLLSYVVTLFMAHVNWRAAIYSTFVPEVRWSGDFWNMVTAILGTTISPYLFFWQAAQESEEIKTHAEEQPLKRAPWQAAFQLIRIKWDTYTGMFVSNFVGWSIIVTCAATLHAHGQKAETATEVAEALRPLAGNGAFLIFALGIIGTGLLALPAFAGSAAYAIGEAMKWPTGLRRKPLDAKAFYAVLTASTLLGLVIPAFHIDPIKALYYAAILNGLAAPPIMVVVMLLAENPKVVPGEFRGTRFGRALGWVATGAMTAVAIATLLMTGRSDS